VRSSFEAGRGSFDSRGRFKDEVDAEAPILTRRRVCRERDGSSGCALLSSSPARALHSPFLSSFVVSVLFLATLLSSTRPPALRVDTATKEHYCVLCRPCRLFRRPLLPRRDLFSLVERVSSAAFPPALLLAALFPALSRTGERWSLLVRGRALAKG
jgi:hypothetical protein